MHCGTRKERIVKLFTGSSGSGSGRNLSKRPKCERQSSFLTMVWRMEEPGHSRCHILVDGVLGFSWAIRRSPAQVRQTNQVSRRIALRILTGLPLDQPELPAAL